MIPRIRGRVGKGDDGKFYFELGLWDFSGENMIGEPLGPFGPYETESIAQDELKRAAQIACEGIEKSHGEEPSGRYMDMKNGGIMRPWKDHS